jgi:hypothetical protein
MPYQGERPEAGYNRPAMSWPETKQASYARRPGIGTATDGPRKVHG